VDQNVDTEAESNVPGLSDASAAQNLISFQHIGGHIDFGCDRKYQQPQGG
jgi:hypothetical protein